MIGMTVVLLALALVCGLPVLAAAYEARSPDYQCAISQYLPAGAELERGAAGEFRVWPVGLECRYFDASGASLTVSPGWFLTVLTAASLAALLAAVAIPAVAGVRRLSAAKTI